MQALKDILCKYIPEAAVDPVFELIKLHHVHLKIVGKRLTRHGDYKKMTDGSHQITVNASENTYRFLITTIHELAHLVAFKTYGRHIKPHGIEWKITFQKLMLPFLNPDVFPMEILPVLARHFKNPKASSDTDVNLSYALSRFDANQDKNRIFELPDGAVFTAQNRLFKKGKKRTKRFECLEINTQKIYLFHPLAEVEIHKN